MEKKVLIIILFLGLILRLSGIVNISLSGDFAIHWKKAHDIIHLETNPFLGPNASINPKLYLGPFYYYLLVIFYLLSKGNYQWAIIFFSFINTFSIYLLYLICKKWFSINTSLKIIGLFSVSSYVIVSQNYPWNPHILILLNLLAVYCLLKIKEGKTWFLNWFLLILGLLLQSHATSILLFPFYLLFLPFRKLKLNNFLPGLGLFFLSISPWFLANFICQNCQLNELLKIIRFPEIQNCNLWEWLGNHGHGENCFHFIRNPLFILKVFSDSLFANKNTIGLIISLLLILWFLFKVKGHFKRLLQYWFLIPAFLFLFYSGNVYPHYFLIFLPLPFIYYVLFLKFLEKNLKYGKIISWLLYGFSFIVNLISYLFSLGNIRY